MRSISSVTLRGFAFVVCLVVPTLIFFAPLAGFHHIVACGVLAPIVLNGEGPLGPDPLWGQYEVRFFLGRFLVSFILWAVSVYFLSRLVNRRLCVA